MIMSKTERQCEHITEEGTRCKRKCEAGYDYCWQHKDEQEYDHNAYRDLTNKQKLFIDYYLKTLNATQSAIKAGYSEKSAHDIGSENLRKPDIKKAINERLEEIQDELIADRNEILRLYTAQLRNSDLSPQDRRKSAEALSKVYGMFIDKAQIQIEETKLEDFMEDQCSQYSVLL